MSFQYSKVKGLALLTSTRLNGQPYRQNPPVSTPVSMATALAMSNLATFTKGPLYKSTPRRHKKGGDTGHREERRAANHHHITSDEEPCRHHHHHPFLYIIAIAIYL
jgi:ABC-type Zn2+ transport system substrate-binding protein/surface adhesin